MAYNPNILVDALRARRLTIAELSRRLGADQNALTKELLREPEPKQGLLKELARELVLPRFAFYMEQLPPLEEEIADFRSPGETPTAKSRDTIKAIKLAEGIQKSVVGFQAPGTDDLPRFTAKSDMEIEKFALEIRERLGVTLDDQRDAKNATAFYVVVRKKIEDAGIIVLQESFPRTDGSGFCLAHPTHPLIVVNTFEQTRGRRLFTLAHELAHALMGRTGISDPFVRENEVERRCNRFATSFLVPQAYVSRLLGSSVARDPTVEDVRWAANRLKISQEATVLRLEQLGIYAKGSHKKWRALVHNNNPDYSDKGGGNEPPPQEKVKLAKYGFRFAALFNRLLDDGLVNEINLYRISGLKPEYQRPYFEYVRSLSPVEIQHLDLDNA